jgi:N6-L-threonylcarbamoyladenine synthase
MNILSIETSCDETAIALLDIKGGLSDVKSLEIKVKKEIVASQIKLHAKFGGVVPNLAKREHIKNLPILLNKILGMSNDKLSRRSVGTPTKASELISNESLKLKNSKLTTNHSSLITSIDLIAVTVGPGLEPALWTGVQFAKDLSKKWKKPIVGVNHLDGHLYSFLLAQKTIMTNDKLQISKKIKNTQDFFPAIALLVSGGHTILAKLEDLRTYKKLGETLDDAVGESFDKVARLLNLPYPGGPALEKLARKGDPKSISFPSPMINQKNYNFSYSGLKTAVLYYLKNLGSTANDFSLSANDKKELKKIESKKNIKADIAASFQYAAFNVIIKKTLRAVEETRAKTIIVGGGVAANKMLSKMIRAEIKNKGLETRVIVPPLKYCMDNGVMIGLAAYINLLKKKKYSLRANGNLNI